MFALYDDNGDFKVGTILSEADASLQLEALHGKRAKVKANSVLLRFKAPAPGALLTDAHTGAADIDVDFLWEASGAEEFGFEDLARDYFGHAPAATEAAAILFKLHSAPMYFYRKGRGRYRAAPAETLKSALAAVEKKRLQQLQISHWVEALKAGQMPEPIRMQLREILYKPDRNRIETKAVEQAAGEQGLTTAQLVDRCGALGPTQDYHFGRFLFEYFPNGTGHPNLVPVAVPELPVAAVRAFSLDDAATTEIDDAFSLTPQPDGRLRLGIHIAAPALGFTAESAIGAIARERLSTVYMPGDKITMLPDSVVAAFTLAEGTTTPAVSLYVDLDPTTFAAGATFSKLERVPIAANLRHHQVESLNAALEADPDGPLPDVPFVTELRTLFRLAQKLAIDRGDIGPNIDRQEYAFDVVDDIVTITARKRGSPLDKLVAEMMILVNRSWGRFLDDHDVAAIYRGQSQGKVRMTTTPAEHQGLGVSHYAWSSSPLRRYVDLVNQWQLVALLDGRAAPFARNSASLLGAIRDFEITYAAYAEFQERMENYWCLRWLLQENVRPGQSIRGQGGLAPADSANVREATVVRENVVKFRDLPFYQRVPSLPELPIGTAVLVEVTGIDLIASTLQVVYKSRVGATPDSAQP